VTVDRAGETLPFPGTSFPEREGEGPGRPTNAPYARPQGNS
jgi:hypothetical protein